MSVSLLAGLPHDGQSTLQNIELDSKGLPLPSKTTSRGNSTGSCSTGTGTAPHASQWMIGIGVPQYLCRLISHGLIFQLIVPLPVPIFSRASQTAAFASEPYSPSKPAIPELTIHPKSHSATSSASSALPSSVIIKTRLIGRSYLFANSKSRSSCPGTAITAPVPYEAITKLPIQIGTHSPVRGWIAKEPVGTPFFLPIFLIRSNSLIATTSSCSNFQSCSYSVPSTKLCANSCSGASVTKVTPKSVSGRVVNTLNLSSRPSTANSISAPSERPIQSCCSALTFSGKSIVSNPSSNS